MSGNLIFAYQLERPPPKKVLGDTLMRSSGLDLPRGEHFRISDPSYQYNGPSRFFFVAEWDR